jgi:hypothetical protein
LFVLLCAALAGATSASDSDQRRAEIRISHNAKTYVLKSWAKDYRELAAKRLEDKLSFVLKPGEKIAVYLEDPNPFFYSYVWSAGGTAATANGDAAKSFAKSLMGLIGGLGPQQAAGGGSAALPAGGFKGRRFSNGIALASFHQDEPPPPPAPLASDGKSIEETLTYSARRLQAVMQPSALSSSETQVEAEKIIDQAVAEVRKSDVPAASDEEVKKVLASAGIPDSEEFLQRMKAALTQLFFLAAQTNSLLQEVDTGHGDTAKQMVKGWPLGDVSKEVEKDYDLLREVGHRLDAVFASETRLRKEAALRGLKADAGTPVADIQKKIKGRSSTKDKEILEGKNCIADLERRDREEEPKNLPLRSCFVTDPVARQKRIKQLELYLRDLMKEKEDLDALDKDAGRFSGIAGSLSQDPFYLSLTFVLPRELEARDAIRGLKHFAATMKKVNEPILLGEVDYASALVTKTTLKITQATDIPDDVLEAVKPSRATKEIDLSFRSYDAVQIGVGGAMVYSFVKSHKFEAKPLSGGGFKVTDTQDSDHTGTDVAAMLTIVPNSWADSDFHPLFEIGVSPQKNLGIFAGLGLTFNSTFSFGAGVAFQQVDELKGLKVGDPLSNAADLKTEKRFATGVYLHFTASATIHGSTNN